MTKEEHFNLIYKTHKIKVTRLVLGYVRGDEDQAKDLVQEIFTKVWSHLDRFEGKSEIGTWIYRIAVNTCLMFLRSKKALPIHTDQIPDTAVQNSLKEKQFKAMYDCIYQLSQKDRTMILLELEDLPQKEIADILGVSHQTVRTQIHRIKDKLSKCVHHERI